VPPPQEGQSQAVTGDAAELSFALALASRSARRLHCAAFLGLTIPIGCLLDRAEALADRLDESLPWSRSPSPAHRRMHSHCTASTAAAFLRAVAGNQRDGAESKWRYHDG
jgi:hypothetical protein